MSMELKSLLNIKNDKLSKEDKISVLSYKPVNSKIINNQLILSATFQNNDHKQSEI